MPKWKPEFWDYETGAWCSMFHWDGRKALFQDETTAWDFIHFCNVPIEIPVRVQPQMVVW